MEDHPSYLNILGGGGVSFQPLLREDSEEKQGERHSVNGPMVDSNLGLCIIGHLLNPVSKTSSQFRSF